MMGPGKSAISRPHPLSLQFIGESGVYLRVRDDVKITAIDGDRVVDCYATRAALEVISCPNVDDGVEVVRAFQRQRDTIEIAAMVKFRRSLAPTYQLEIGAADVAMVLPITGTS
jgi:hypothetical protein